MSVHAYGPDPGLGTGCKCPQLTLLCVRREADSKAIECFMDEHMGMPSSHFKHLDENNSGWLQKGQKMSAETPPGRA